MYNYTFTFSSNFSSDDPQTPMGGSPTITLVIQAENIEAAKDALATVFTPTVGDSSVDISGIYIAGA